MSKLVGLGGYLRAGKDTVADRLEEEHGFVKMGMSDPLHEITLMLNPRFRLDYPIRMGYLWAKTYETYHYRDIIDSVGYVEAKQHGEIRTWLQVLGTEVGRNRISESVWIDIAERRIKELLDAGKNVALTATRFPNEVEMIHRLGGQTVWITRDAEKRNDGASSGVESHSSETSVGPEDFDLAIENNGSLEDLADRVDAMVDGLPEAIRHTKAESNTYAWPHYDN